MDVRFSITIRQRASLRDLIEAIPEEDWLDGRRADVAETTCTPFQSEPDARFPAALFATWRPTTVRRSGFLTHPLPLAATPRSRMPSETSSTVWG